MASRYEAECREWQEIAQEIAQEHGAAVAYDVSDEQRRRMALRGERPMTFEEIVAEASAASVTE